MADAKTTKKAAAPMTDVVGQMAVQKLLHETFGAVTAPEPVPGDKKPKSPTVFTVVKDTKIATAASGPMLVRRGQEVSSPMLLSALREAGAELRAVR